MVVAFSPLLAEHICRFLIVLLWVDMEHELTFCINFQKHLWVFSDVEDR